MGAQHSALAWTTGSRSTIRPVPGGFTMRPEPDPDWRDIRDESAAGTWVADPDGVMHRMGTRDCPGCRAPERRAESCIHPGVFAAGRPAEYCRYCGQDVEQHLL
jgi:hypothetical protein